MPVYNSITGEGTPPPADDGSYDIINITVQAEPDLEASDPTQPWLGDTWEDPVCRDGDNMSYNTGGYSSQPSDSPAPEPVNKNGAVEPTPPEPSTVGVELSVSAQVFIGASLKAAILTDSNGQTGFSVTVAGRAGWAFGVSAEAAGVYAPGQGVDKMGGVSVGGQVEAVVASAGVSQNVGNSGPEGPPTFTVSPPGAGVGVMVGVTSELELTGVVTGPKTAEEADAMLRSLN